MKKCNIGINGISISRLQENAANIDAETIHKLILGKVKSGEYETCLQALADYYETNDLDIVTINKYISPALRCILLKEAMDRNMLIRSSATIPKELLQESP